MWLRILDFAYETIEKHYGETRTKRSGQLYMRHIDEGLKIIQHLGGCEHTQAAFCLHPLLQADADLTKNWQWLANQSHPWPMGLAMEYRNIANRFLSPMDDHPGFEDPKKITLSPLHQVNVMLVADKVQNRMDFLDYHRDHPRFDRIDLYFQVWLKALEIDEAQYELLVSIST